MDCWKSHKIPFCFVVDAAVGMAIFILTDSTIFISMSWFLKFHRNVLLANISVEDEE